MKSFFAFVALLALRDQWQSTCSCGCWDTGKLSCGTWMESPLKTQQRSNERRRKTKVNLTFLATVVQVLSFRLWCLVFHAVLCSSFPWAVWVYFLRQIVLQCPKKVFSWKGKTVNKSSSPQQISSFLLNFDSPSTMRRSLPGECLTQWRKDQFRRKNFSGLSWFQKGKRRHDGDVCPLPCNWVIFNGKLRGSRFSGLGSTRPSQKSDNANWIQTGGMWHLEVVGRSLNGQWKALVQVASTTLQTFSTEQIFHANPTFWSKCSWANLVMCKTEIIFSTFLSRFVTKISLFIVSKCHHDWKLHETPKG